MRRIFTILLIFTISGIGFSQETTTSFSSGEFDPLLKYRVDLEKRHSSVETMDNMLVKLPGAAIRRPGTEFIAQVATYEDVFANAIAAYEMTYISENASIWGIPLNYETFTTLTLDVGGIARDVGGGIVGVPCTGHPFAIGEVIKITGTLLGPGNYLGNHTLTSGTTVNELQFADDFRAETFTADSRVVQWIGLKSGAGRMDQDADGNIYYGHQNPDYGYITKIELDGTVIHNFFTPDDAWPDDDQILGIKVSSDNLYLYAALKVVTTSNMYLYKFNLSDGSQVWRVLAGDYPGYDMAIDSDDNAYILAVSTGGGGRNIAKFSAEDGTKTDFDLMGEILKAGFTGGFPYAIWIDNDMSCTSGKTGVVIAGGSQKCLTRGHPELLYNLAIRDLDNEGGYQVALGGTYVDGSYTETRKIYANYICTMNRYIYVLAIKTDERIVYKLDSRLNVITQTAHINKAIGLFPDPLGNIVVVCQSSSSPVSDQFHFYDDDLNYITKIDHFSTSMLLSWDASPGGSWIQGNVIFWPGITQTLLRNLHYSSGDGNAAVRLIPFGYSTDDSYILALGNGYISFFRTE